MNRNPPNKKGIKVYQKGGEIVYTEDGAAAKIKKADCSLSWLEK